MMKKFFILFLWLVSIATAYWLGLGNSLKSPKSDNPSGSEDLPSNLTDTKISTRSVPQPQSFLSEEIFPEDDENYDNRRMLSGQEAILDLEKSLRSTHPVQRLQAFAWILQDPDLGNIQTALNAYESWTSGSGRLSELKTLSFAWGQVDPQAALKWAQKQEHWEKYVANSSIMDSWARRDADAAIAWAKANFDGDDNPYYVGIINGLSESSLPRATDLMTELPYGRIRGRSAHLLFEKVWNKGEDTAIHWAEHLPEGSLQNFAYGELGEKLARSDMPRAIEWVESMEESPIKAAVSKKVVREIAKKSPPESAEWVASLPEGKSKTSGMMEVAEIWSQRDPAAVAEWINELPADTNRDPLIETLVNKIHKSDPQSALAWAETISNPERRKLMTDKVVKIIKAEKFPN